MSGGADGNTDEFLDVIRETRARYVAGFADQLDHLRALGDNPTQDQLQAFRTVVHRMAGLSGTVGFRSVGVQAAELEALVETSLVSGRVDPDAVRRLIQSMGAAFTRDLSSPPAWAIPAAQSAAPGRILIVEDDDDQRALVCGYLEQAGFKTIAIASGDLAVETTKRERPSLVMLDVHLPGMDGYSVCRILKADAETRAIPIVFATTRAALNERLAGLALGADDYLTKPIDMGELVIRVRRLIEARRAGVADNGTPEGRLQSYDAWLAAARDVLAAGDASIALLRAAEPLHEKVAAALTDNLRRRDVVGAYDRTHLLILMPGVVAARAIEMLESSLGDLPPGATHAGVASGSGRTVEDLIAEADEALASARHNGVLASGRVEASPRPRGAARSVLLADDDPDVMRIVDAHMRGLGFTTTVVFDGQAAINALDAQPDVVVLDLMMPKMTGFEVLQHLSELGPRRPKAIVLSARGREDDVTRAFDLGADDYMVKPFSPQELGARVGRLLR